MSMKIIEIEYRGSGFYGNRPKSIRKVETLVADPYGCDGLYAHGLISPISWAELLDTPKRKGRKKCAQ